MLHFNVIVGGKERKQIANLIMCTYLSCFRLDANGPIDVVSSGLNFMSDVYSYFALLKLFIIERLSMENDRKLAINGNLNSFLRCDVIFSKQPRR